MKLVGLAIAEFVRTREGELGTARPGHELLMQALAYDNASTVRRHVAKLVKHEWLEIVAAHAPGRAAIYRLRLPSTLPGRAIDELENPSEGMWSRVILLRTHPPVNTVQKCAVSETPTVGISQPNSGDFSTAQRAEMHSTPCRNAHLSTSEVFNEVSLEVRGAPRARRRARGAPTENTLPTRDEQLAELERRARGAS